MSEQTPKNLSEILLGILWKQKGRKRIVVVVIVSICFGVFIIWNSLPDEYKIKLLSSESIAVEGLVVGSNEDNSKVEITVYNGFDEEQVLKKIKLTNEYYQPNRYCMLLDVPVYEFQNSVRIEEKNGRELFVRWDVKSKEGGLAGYNVAARGGTKSGCGYYMRYVEIPSSVVLPKKSFSSIFLIIPKSLEMIYKDGAFEEKIGTKAHQSFEFSLEELERMEVFIQTSKGSANYKSDANRAFHRINR